MEIVLMVAALIAAPIFLRDLLKSNLEVISKIYFGSLMAIWIIEKIIRLTN